MKPKILIVTDSPLLHTGQGIVHKYIGLELHKRGYEVVSLGWSSENSPAVTVPWYVYKTNQKDYYGMQMFDSIINYERPDIVISIGDIWNIEYISKSQVRGLFYWIGYTAVDGCAFTNGIPAGWVPVLEDMDKVITYTSYGKNIISNSVSRKDIEIIPHGVDLNLFKQFSENDKYSLRKKKGIPENSIIYLVVARNQFRKNIPEILKAWALFKRDVRHEKAFLFLHMLFNDSHGWNLDELIDTYKIRSSIMFIEKFAYAHSNLNTISDDSMTGLYNMADVHLLLSGEGWGLPITEAMACGVSQIVLNHSACGELVKDKGELVDVDYYVTGIRGTERPYPNMTMLVKAMDKLYFDDDLRKEYGKKSLEFVKNYSWDKVGVQWENTIEKVINPFLGKCSLIKVA